MGTESNSCRSLFCVLYYRFVICLEPRTWHTWFFRQANIWAIFFVLNSVFFLPIFYYFYFKLFIIPHYPSKSPNDRFLGGNSLYDDVNARLAFCRRPNRCKNPHLCICFTFALSYALSFACAMTPSSSLWYVTIRRRSSFSDQTGTLLRCCLFSKRQKSTISHFFWCD